MSAARPVAAFLALVSAVTCVANERDEILRESLWEDVHDLCIVDDVAFVVRDPNRRDPSVATDLHSVVPPALAVKNGHPDEHTLRLVSPAHTKPWEAAFDHAVLSPCFSGEYLWTLFWHLTPSEGAFVGQPAEYRSVVRSDGAVVLPDVFLVDFCVPANPEGSEPLFSVFALEDLCPLDDAVVSEKEIVRVAQEAFASGVPAVVVSESRFQPLTPVRRVVRARERGDNTKVKECELWGVQFVSSTIEGAGNLNSNALMVWVSARYKTSTISVGRWRIGEGGMRATQASEPSKSQSLTPSSPPGERVRWNCRPKGGRVIPRRDR